MRNLQKRLEIEEENERHLAIPYLTKVKCTNHHPKNNQGWDSNLMLTKQGLTLLMTILKSDPVVADGCTLNHCPWFSLEMVKSCYRWRIASFNFSMSLSCLEMRFTCVIIYNINLPTRINQGKYCCTVSYLFLFLCVCFSLQAEEYGQRQYEEQKRITAYQKEFEQQRLDKMKAHRSISDHLGYLSGFTKWE